MILGQLALDPVGSGARRLEKMNHETRGWGNSALKNCVSDVSSTWTIIENKYEAGQKHKIRIAHVDVQVCRGGDIVREIKYLRNT